MTEDGKVVINTEINTDGAKKGLNELGNTLKTNTSAQKLNIASLAKLGTAVGAVATATKLTTKAINECTAAYKVQARAEVQLETAAKNNPYLDKNSVITLKNYASELQSISTYGDEQLIPFMAQLASAGRTQSEIMDIMSASIDVASSGVMSLDEAVTNLNRTYSGQIGRLGMTIPQVKELTAEQLKNGEATKIVAEQFKGMAKSVADATGTSEQLKNAWGDLKEQIGAPFEKAMSPIRKFFTELISGWADAAKERNNYNNAVDKRKSGSADSIDYETLIKKAKEEVEVTKETVDNLLNMDEAKRKLFDYSKALTNAQKLYENSQKSLEQLQNELEVKKEIENAEEQKLKAEKENNEIAKKNAEIEEKAAQAKLNYNKTVREAEKNITLREKLGEKISEEEKAQEMLNVRMSAYIKMIEEAEGTISGNIGFAKEEADRIAAESNRLFELNNPAEDPNQNAIEVLKTWENQKTLTYQQQLDMLSNYEDYINSLENKGDKELEILQRISDAKDNINKEMVQKQKDKMATMLSDINSYISEFANITQSVTDLIRSSNEEETNQEMSDLSKQYTDGLISYEEYCEKKKAIDKKAAQEEYKLKMWEWTASLLTATANVAEGVSKAIAQGGLAGIITGALVAASGAIQIASITANKPQAPKFATGGIVGGSSYTGDKVPAMLNSREMVLNMGQQQRLFDIANGTANGNGAVLNMPVTINNNSSAQVSTKMNKNGLVVMVDEMVNASMQAGKYTDSMHVAQARSNGASYY